MPQNADAFVIDQRAGNAGYQPKNNTRRTSGAFPGLEPFRQVKMLSPFQKANRNIIGCYPWVGWNNADKTMLGLVLYNPPLPPRKCSGVSCSRDMHWAIEKTGGTGRCALPFSPGRLVSQSDHWGGAKTFDADYNAANEYYTRFYRA